MGRKITAGVVLAGGLVLGGCGGGDDPASTSTPSPSTTTVTVNFTLHDVATYSSGCTGQGGYSDIRPGAQVVIRNGENDILGAESLETGIQVGNYDCLWSVKVDDVPLGEDFYSAEVGDRGAITMNEDDLSAADYMFGVSLGS